MCGNAWRMFMPVCPFPFPLPLVRLWPCSLDHALLLEFTVFDKVKGHGLLWKPCESSVLFLGKLKVYTDSVNVLRKAVSSLRSVLNYKPLICFSPSHLPHRFYQSNISNTHLGHIALCLEPIHFPIAFRTERSQICLDWAPSSFFYF